MRPKWAVIDETNFMIADWSRAGERSLVIEGSLSRVWSICVGSDGEKVGFWITVFVITGLYLAYQELPISSTLLFGH